MIRLLAFSFLLILTFANAEAGKYRGHFKVGNPYEVLGKWYYPEIDNEYNEIGQASWYGDKFHRKKTANGEIFRKTDLTAAHPTLPLPSIVDVTNLENGKSLTIKINDRGPFLKDRIIDLSEKAAKKLGFYSQGTATVQVIFNEYETNKLHRKLFGKEMLSVATAHNEAEANYQLR